MESFNRGEHVIAAFLDVEKAFDNVWHNRLRYKIYQLNMPNPSHYQTNKLQFEDDAVQWAVSKNIDLAVHEIVHQLAMLF